MIVLSITSLPRLKSSTNAAGPDLKVLKWCDIDKSGRRWWWWWRKKSTPHFCRCVKVWRLFFHQVQTPVSRKQINKTTTCVECEPVIDLVMELAFIINNWENIAQAYLHMLSVSLVFTGVLKNPFTFTHCDFHFAMQWSAHTLKPSCGWAELHCNNRLRWTKYHTTTQTITLPYV